MLPAAERAQMRINGELVAELDIRASFLTILYAQRGQAFDLSTDPYIWVTDNEYMGDG